MTEYVCSNCGSDRVSDITPGIDHWPLGKCATCSFGGTHVPPDSDTSEKAQKARAQAIRVSATQRRSQRASHTKFVPLMPREQWRPRPRRVEAESQGMFD